MKTMRWGLLVPLVVLFCGCSQKLTYEHWELIGEGQSSEAVQATLGEPVEKLDMSWLYMDADRGITANIYFDENKVIGKTWCDPDRGMQGKSPHVNEVGDKEELKYRKVE